jgi:hypothetical protein
MICTGADIFVLVRCASIPHSETQLRRRLLHEASEVANEPWQRCEMIRGARQRPRIFFLERYSTGTQENYRTLDRAAD